MTLNITLFYYFFSKIQLNLVQLFIVLNLVAKTTLFAHNQQSERVWWGSVFALLYVSCGDSKAGDWNHLKICLHV